MLIINERQEMWKTNVGSFGVNFPNGFTLCAVFNTQCTVGSGMGNLERATLLIIQVIDNLCTYAQMRYSKYAIGFQRIHFVQRLHEVLPQLLQLQPQYYLSALYIVELSYTR